MQHPHKVREGVPTKLAVLIAISGFRDFLYPVPLIASCYMQIIISYLNLLGHSDTALIQRAWNHMNDSLRTNVFVCYRPETIACACIFLAARELEVRECHILHLLY